MGFIEQMERALERVDGWANLVTGVGTDRRSKRLGFSPDAILPEELLEQLYVGDPYANRICRVVPEEALRQGAKITTGDAAADTAVAEHVDAFEVNARLTLAWTWSRVFGGGAVLLGADDGRPPWEPLDESAIRTVAFLDVVDARELRPDRYETNPRAKLFGEPLTYRLSRTGGGGASESAVWHRSRLILFDGAPTTRRRRQLLHGWGESELQRLYGILAHFNGGWEATGTLLQQASEGVFTLKGLMSMMAADKKDVLKRRLEMMDLARGVTRSVLLDEGESYTRTEVGALTGVADLLTKNLLLLSGAAEIPVTVLMGQSPAGLSATGESDVRWFYDRTKSAQEQVLLSRHRQLARILLAAKDGPTAGQIPARLAITYPPLWQPTPMEAADLRVKQSQVDNTYITAQVVTAEEVAASRFGAGTWSAETTIDLTDRAAAQQADRDAAALTTSTDTEVTDKAAAVVAKVAAREIPRDAGIGLLTTLGLTPEAAEASMGESGRTFFTTPEPGHAQQLADAQGEVAKLTRSVQGHKAYTARLIQRARDGGLELGAFTAREPTDVAEGDGLEPGDVVAVPVEDSRFEVRRVDGRSDGFAVVLQLPPAYASRLPTETPAEDLHITLAFLGMNDRGDPQSIDRAVAAVRLWALTVAPIGATLGGIGRFAGGPAGEPVYVPVDSPAITDTRPALVAFLRAAGFEVAKGHGFTPHLTLAYVQPGDATPAPVPPFAVTCPTVSVWWDSVRVDIELTGGA